MGKQTHVGEGAVTGGAVAAGLLDDALLGDGGRPPLVAVGKSLMKSRKFR